MLATILTSMAAAVAGEAGATTPAGGVASALIGSGVSLLARRDRRLVGVALIAAGGLIVWRRAAREEQVRRVRPNARPVASVQAA